MSSHNKYDVIITGGGLAGLSLSILLTRKNFRVALFEKEKYPFHKVCGEYMSLESYEFLQQLGIKAAEKNLPVIKHLVVSSPSGKTIDQQLPLGGFGISRFAIDAELAEIAGNDGVAVFDRTRVQDIIYDRELFNVVTDKEQFQATHVCGAFGKRSNLDIKWKRDFVQHQPSALNNFIAVKYHVQLDHPRDTISLHNFRNGYCGISPIEDGTTCICYLTTAANLQECGNHIGDMEKTILAKNPLLKKVLSDSVMLYEKPLAIAQISFDQKEQVRDHVLLAGDAAGLITPLCGNGMSMALGASRIAAELIGDQLGNKITRNEMENLYSSNWKSEFGRRLRAGRMIQALFGKEWLTDAAVGTLRHFPKIVSRIIRQTHG